ncbi:MAG: serine racemase VanT catalytic subunit [Coprobacillus sp.]|nr:serine racemase VanT catalytic subunit [Coprobacillus sp.]
MKQTMYDCYRSWIEIDLKALQHNIIELISLLDDPQQLMAVVKADAYGHGAVQISQKLNQMGVSSFAVATLSEAIELRENNIIGDILILGHTDAKQAKLIHQYQLIQTVVDYEHALALEQEQIDIQVHIAVDSGMHRLGLTLAQIQKIKTIYSFQYLHIQGIFSHLCVSDEKTLASQKYTQYQINNFFEIIKELKRDKLDVGKVHIQSSYGLLNYSTLHCDFVRVGIMMYGVYSSKQDQNNNKISLNPVLSLKSKIIHIHHIQKNETIGYGRTYQSDKKRKIAIVPIGYADGIPRDLSNYGYVIVHSQKVPIIGRICMDQLTIDISDIDGVNEGDIVTIIGQDGIANQDVETIAEMSHTISNEILSQLGSRLPRIIKGGQLCKEGIINHINQK